MHFRYFIVFAVFASGSLIAQDMPIRFSDEDQILELGSVVLDDEQSISIVQDPVFKEPFMAVYPLAAAMHSFVFQQSNYSKRAHRILGWLSHLLTAAMMTLLLQGLGSNKLVSILQGLLLLFDPLYTASWASGRVDLWGISLFLASLVFSTRHTRYSLIVSGVLLALSVLSWPSSLTLLPLFCALYLQTNLDQQRLTLRQIFVDVCVVLTGLVVTGTIILVAFHGERLPQAVVHFRQFLSEIESGGTYPWKNLLKAFSLQIHIVALAAVSIAYLAKKRTILVIGILLSTWMAVKDNPYRWRALFGSVGLYLGLFTALFELHKESASRKFTIHAKLVITSLLIIGFAGSVVVRHVNGFGRDRSIFNDTVLEQVQSLNLAGDYIVYDSELAFYPIGAPLGWRFNRPLRRGTAWTDEQFAEFVTENDIIIQPSTDPSYKNLSSPWLKMKSKSCCKMVSSTLVRSI